MQQMIEAYLRKDYNPEQIVGVCQNNEVRWCISWKNIKAYMAG